MDTTGSRSKYDNRQFIYIYRLSLISYSQESLYPSYFPDAKSWKRYIPFLPPQDILTVVSAV